MPHMIHCLKLCAVNGAAPWIVHSLDLTLENLALIDAAVHSAPKTGQCVCLAQGCALIRRNCAVKSVQPQQDVCP